MKLNDRIAVITGGTQGIGKAIALRMAAEGATVVVVASRRLPRSQAVVDEIVRLGGRAVAKVADVTKSAELGALALSVVADFGRIDILVNAAGAFVPTPAGAAIEADVDRMIATNLKGSFMAIDAVVPAMKRQRAGKIINIASVAGFMGIGTYAIYCATKAGIMSMTRALACELAPHGINVNAVAPGNTATPMNDGVRTLPEFKPMLDAMSARTPSGRTFSTAEEMAGMAVFLATSDARSMHGSTVLMDEGFSAGM
jgi:3-oxoacyl-[acyl-carrier protein] reductase